MNAFERWLLNQPRQVAVAHVMDCLISGDRDNAAWALMEAAHGPKWSCAPSELRQLVDEAITALERPAAS